LSGSEAILELRDIRRSFFGVEVLRGITLRLAAGRILGLVGENGAGKSTLMNILGGVLPPDSGDMSFNGQPHAPRTPRAARAAGIAFVHQELSLFPNLSIAENLFIESLPRRRVGPITLPLIDHAHVRQSAAALLAQVDLRRDPRTAAGELPPGERQLVEIARALAADARLIILDEPTTSLTAPETQRLFAIMQRLRSRGVAMIYISHRLEDVLSQCDDIAVLRDGRLISTGPKSDFTAARMIAEMVGRDVTDTTIAAASAGPELLRVINLSRHGILDNISFSLHQGQVLGIAGLMGAGRTELARAIFGLDPIDAGAITLDGQPFTPSPRESIARGVVFLTEDRREEGLLMDDTILANASLAVLPRFAASPLKFIRRRKLAAAVTQTTAAAQLRAANPARQIARTLSGGNQQKVVLAKWLINRPRLLILDEPTRGIDVGAKQEIHKMIRDLARQGAAVLVISSEIEELLALCDAILVMSRGHIVDRLARADFDRERILRAALGGAP
jgi:ribose transport system ATP-binding protein